MLQRFLFIVSLFASLNLMAQDTTQQIISGRKNSPEQITKPYVILISADGFRADFTELYEAKKLQALSKQGIRGKYMIPLILLLLFRTTIAL